jgi:hypothetical protein
MISTARSGLVMTVVSVSSTTTAEGATSCKSRRCNGAISGRLGTRFHTRVHQLAPVMISDSTGFPHCDWLPRVTATKYSRPKISCRRKSGNMCGSTGNWLRYAQRASTFAVI